MIAAAVAAAWLSGCAATEVPSRARDPIVGDQGRQWEAVFLPASTEMAVALAGEGEEASRRDWGLPVRPGTPLLAATQWPEPEPPTVERFRRVRLPRDARDALFFVPYHSPRWHHLYFGPAWTWP